jgi:hypothetical protein
MLERVGPLAAKLGIKPGQLVVLNGAPAGWTVPDLPEKVSVLATAERADVVVAFFGNASDLRSQVSALGEVVKPAGSLWLAWPRRAGGHSSDITDNVVRAAVLPLGLVDVKVAALDYDWSALKIVWRKELRTAGP